MTRLQWSGFVLAAALCGVAAVKPVMGVMLERTAIHDGPWRTSISTGRVDAGLYERAAVAIAGLYALSPQETIYYTAFTDSDGRALEGACTYRLSGSALPARWWSLTMYGADSYLVDNPDYIYSRHAANLKIGTDGHYDIVVASATHDGNWLPSPASGAYSITARLYNPERAVYEHPAIVALPTLTREACP